jgi:hypothetical protein
MTEHLNAPDAKFILFQSVGIVDVLVECRVANESQHDHREGKPFLHLSADKHPTGLYFLAPSQTTPFLPSLTFAPLPAESESESNKDLLAKSYQSARLPSTTSSLVFLGIDDRPSAKPGSEPAAQNPREPKGVPYFAIDVPAGSDVGLKDGGFVESRLAGSSLDGWEANLYAQGRSLIGTSFSPSLVFLFNPFPPHLFISLIPCPFPPCSLLVRPNRLEHPIQVLSRVRFPDLFALVWLETRLRVYSGRRSEWVRGFGRESLSFYVSLGIEGSGVDPDWIVVDVSCLISS